MAVVDLEMWLPIHVHAYVYAALRSGFVPFLS